MLTADQSFHSTTRSNDHSTIIHRFVRFICLLLPLLIALCMPRIPSSLPRALYASLRSTTPARLTPTTTPTPTYLSHATRLSGLSLPFAFFSSTSSDKMSDPQPKLQKSESEWKAILSPEQVRSRRKLNLNRHLGLRVLVSNLEAKGYRVRRVSPV